MPKTIKRTAWIIGASSGLGAALARRLADEGYSVAISARRKELLDALTNDNTNMTAFPVDAGNAAAVTNCAADVIAAFGHVDLFVYCAVRSGGEECMLENMSKGMGVGLIGAIAALEPIIANMKENKHGQIALFGSPVGFRALPGTGSYGPVKSALHYLAEQLKIELAQDKIDVQLVLPGFVDTELTQRNKFPMPFLMNIDTATDRIWSGLQSPKRFAIAFPKRLIWPMRAMAALPNFFYFALMRMLHNKM